MKVSWITGDFFTAYLKFQTQGKLIIDPFNHIWMYTLTSNLLLI